MLPQVRVHAYWLPRHLGYDRCCEGDPFKGSSLSLLCTEQASIRQRLLCSHNEACECVIQDMVRCCQGHIDDYSSSKWLLHA